MSALTMQVGDIWLKDTSALHADNKPIWALVLERSEHYNLTKISLLIINLDTGVKETWFLQNIDFKGSPYYKKVA